MPSASFRLIAQERPLSFTSYLGLEGLGLADDNKGFSSPSYDFLYKVLVFSRAASCQSSAADSQGHPWLTTTGGFSTQ